MKRFMTGCGRLLFLGSMLTCFAVSSAADTVSHSKAHMDSFAGLKTVNIYICDQIANDIKAPTWLKRDALIQDAIVQAVDGSFPISYADGKPHQPEIQECDGISVLNDPDALNFVVRVNASKRRIHSEEVPIAVVERYIYRPGLKNGMATFLRGYPVVLDLSDEEKAYAEFTRRKQDWAEATFPSAP